MPSIEKINSMSPEELAALNKKLGKRLMLTILVRIATVVAVSLAVSALINKLTTPNDEDED